MGFPGKLESNNLSREILNRGIGCISVRKEKRSHPHRLNIILFRSWLRFYAGLEFWRLAFTKFDHALIKHVFLERRVRGEIIFQSVKSVWVNSCCGFARQGLYETNTVEPLSNGWALCPAWFPKVLHERKTDPALTLSRGCVAFECGALPQQNNIFLHVLLLLLPLIIIEYKTQNNIFRSLFYF